MSIFTERRNYKPFEYVGAIDLYDNSLRQEIKALSKILLKNDIEEYKIQFLGTRDRKFLPLIMFTRF